MEMDHDAMAEWLRRMAYHPKVTPETRQQALRAARLLEKIAAVEPDDRPSAKQSSPPAGMCPANDNRFLYRY